MLPSW
jgi:lysophospholipase L1-like esterase